MCLTLTRFSYVFLVVCSFPPKIKITISMLALAQRNSKALGGIDSVMLQISTDSTSADHTSLMLMGSTGFPSEVNITP